MLYKKHKPPISYINYEIGGKKFPLSKIDLPLESDERPDYTVVTAATDFHRASLSFRFVIIRLNYIISIEYCQVF